jgi:hypothetical protein
MPDVGRGAGWSEKKVQSQLSNCATQSRLSRLRLPRDPRQTAEHITQRANTCRHGHLAHDRQLVVRAQLHQPTFAAKPCEEVRNPGEHRAPGMC